MIKDLNLIPILNWHVTRTRFFEKTWFRSMSLRYISLCYNGHSARPYD